MTLYKSKSEHFRKNFLDLTHIKVLDDSKGFSPNRADVQKPLTILMSMAGLLVVLCAINVATLLLLRAARRAREMSMRYALGARRSRVISQLFVEGGLLGLAGAAAGSCCLLRLSLRALVRMMTSSDPGTEPYSASVDTRALLFTLALSLLATLVFSIAPVFHFLRPDLAGSLRQNAGTPPGTRSSSARSPWASQIALSVLLLGGAGLFVRTLDNLRHQQVGYETANLATFALDPTGIRVRRRSHSADRQRLRWMLFVAFRVSFPSRPPMIPSSSATLRLLITRCRDTNRRKTST